MSNRQRADLMAEAFPSELYYGSGNFIRRAFERSRIEHVLALCGDVRHKKVLDAGAGDGYFLRRMDCARKWGADISPARCGRIVAIAPQANIVVSDLRNIPFPDGFFDGAICAHVLEHVDDPGSVVEELKRVTRRGGFLVFSFPNEIMFVLLRSIHLIYPPFNPDHIRWLTPSKPDRMVGRGPRRRYNIPDLPYPFCVEQCYRYDL